MSRLHVAALSFLLTAGCLAGMLGSISPQALGQVAYPEQEVRVQHLPALTASSSDSTDVLATCLAIIIHKKAVCCDKDSALEDAVERADPKSLKDVADKLKGRHLLSDGRPIMVTAEFLTPSEVNAGHIIYMLQNQHAPLMEWNSQLYVVLGVTYVESVNYSEGAASKMDTVHKFLLEDVGYSDSRRVVDFDRLTENTGRVQGFLFVDWKPQ